ncbi:hypothetical protein [Streptomyces werraensis]|uniref:hypothetical protein n=1 Tax=Streptomyces werraensis TaxID=68284 RepID=UPI0036F59583
MAHVAKDLGIHKEALRGWVRQAQPTPARCPGAADRRRHRPDTSEVHRRRAEDPRRQGPGQQPRLPPRRSRRRVPELLRQGIRGRHALVRPHGGGQEGDLDEYGSPAGVAAGDELCAQQDA